MTLCTTNSYPERAGFYIELVYKLLATLPRSQIARVHRAIAPSVQIDIISVSFLVYLCLMKRFRLIGRNVIFVVSSLRTRTVYLLIRVLANSTYMRSRVPSLAYTSGRPFFVEKLMLTARLGMALATYSTRSRAPFRQHEWRGRL